MLFLTFANYSQQDAIFLEFICFYRRSTCFRRFLRPSSGARNCTYSFRYFQPIPLLAATVDEMCPPQTCRAYVKINKFKKSCILLAVICNYIMMQRHMNIKSIPQSSYYTLSGPRNKAHRYIIINLSPLLHILYKSDRLRNPT